MSANTKEQPSMMVTLHCEPRGTEVRALKFRENEEVLDLNEDFDEMWPLIVAMEPAILEAYRKVADDAAQSEDFSF
ncbi:MAG: hypothetical protein QF489_01625 [Planctomycetota bacterium]|nr:hypothetical protein [Planctomycetota bacterium]